MRPLRAYHQSGLVEWQRCPRRFWFQHVADVEPDYASTGYAAPLGVAGHAGCQAILQDPDLPRQRLLDVLLAAFDDDLARGQERGRTYDPEVVQRALERLETEYLDLVLRLGQDPRVRAIEWTHTELAFEWSDAHGRTFAGTVDAIGRVREPLSGFGVDGRDPVDLAPGEWVLVDWKFGRELELTRVALALNLQLAYYAHGVARLFPGRRFRPFLGVVRDLAPSQRPTDDEGRVIRKTLEELNPDYLAAFAGDREITESLRKAADKSRRRFRTPAGKPIPKRVRRPNPEWEAAVQQPKGPVFHEARLAWDVVRPTIVQTIHEIEIAGRQGGEAAYPARGPVTGACRYCPFHRKCTALPTHPNQQPA